MSTVKIIDTGIRKEKCLKSERPPFVLLPHQEKVKNYFINSPHRGLLLYHLLGSGKCHAIDTPIILNNGKIKMVQDIKVGDLLMGDDSRPRTVTSLARGEDEIYEIIPKKGDSYKVNQEHILCLKASGFPKIIHQYTNYNIQYIENNKFNSKTFSYKKNDTEDQEKKKIEAEIFFNNVSKDNIIEISVIDYLKLPKYKKDCLKTYRVPVNFPEQKVNIDPYIIGYWLGDGSKSSVITTQDSSIIYHLKKELPTHNLSLNYLSKYGKIDSNISLNTLEENKLNNKHIPDIYKYNSRENRLKLLAGLIDSCGSLQKDYFEFSQSIEKEKLFDDVIFLTRSLGFACYKTNKGDAFRIHISGEGIEQIPTKIPQKQAKFRKQKKDVLVSGIKVKHIGRDNYYGFTLDGNCRYLLGDFTVTHNTCSAISIADELLNLGKVDKVYVCTPGSLRKNFVTEYCRLCGIDQTYLDKYYTFITYNTNIFESVQKINFNNSLVIIDEGHNLMNGAKNISKNPHSLYNQIFISNARVLVLTATVIFNNTIEWCLIGNLLKNDTFPDIINGGKFDRSILMHERNVFNDEKMSGIISYFPGYETDHPEVIKHSPIRVLLPLKYSDSLSSIIEKENLTIGKLRAKEKKQNGYLSPEERQQLILLLKRIRSRSFSNVNYQVLYNIEYAKLRKKLLKEKQLIRDKLTKTIKEREKKYEEEEEEDDENEEDENEDDEDDDENENEDEEEEEEENDEEEDDEDEEEDQDTVDFGESLFYDEEIIEDGTEEEVDEEQMFKKIKENIVLDIIDNCDKDCNKKYIKKQLDKENIIIEDDELDEILNNIKDINIDAKKSFLDYSIEKGGWISHDILKNKILNYACPKIVAIIVNILKNINTKQVIFSYFIKRGGLLFVHTLLTMCGIKCEIYSGEVSAEKRSQILDTFNSIENRDGKIIKVLLTTEAGCEGITMLEVENVHILETNPNTNKTLQCIGRAARYRSHINLPKERQIVNVWKYYATIISLRIPLKKDGKIYGYEIIKEGDIDLSFLNTFEQYYDYYIKGDNIKLLKDVYGRNIGEIDISFESGIDEILDIRSGENIVKYKEIYDILQKYSIERTGLIDKVPSKPLSAPKIKKSNEEIIREIINNYKGDAIKKSEIKRILKIKNIEIEKEEFDNILEKIMNE